MNVWPVCTNNSILIGHRSQWTVSIFSNEGPRGFAETSLQEIKILPIRNNAVCMSWVCTWFCRTLRKYSSALGCCNSLIPRSSPHVLSYLPLHLFPNAASHIIALIEKRRILLVYSAKPHAPHAVQCALISICLVCDFKLECVAPEFPWLDYSEFPYRWL